MNSSENIFFCSYWMSNYSVFLLQNVNVNLLYENKLHNSFVKLMRDLFGRSVKIPLLSFWEKNNAGRVWRKIFVSWVEKSNFCLIVKKIRCQRRTFSFLNQITFFVSVEGLAKNYFNLAQHASSFVKKETTEDLQACFRVNNYVYLFRAFNIAVFYRPL